LDEQTKTAFEFARDITIQLITLATGVIALEVTLLKDIVENAPEAVRMWALASWIVFGLSIVFGVATVLALTGTLQPKDSSKTPKIWEPSVRRFSGAQIVSFLVGLSMTIIFGGKVLSVDPIRAAAPKTAVGVPSTNGTVKTPAVPTKNFETRRKA
jgi:hypothetical protein